MKLEIYTLKTCDYCRKAVKWLRENGIPFEEIPIREQPPTLPELSLALKSANGDIRKLFNTSGMDYRALGLKDKLPGMNEAQCIELLSKNGNLVKRPFVIGDGIALAGFKPEIWGKALL